MDEKVRELTSRFDNFSEKELHKALIVLCFKVHYHGPVTANEMHAAADRIETDRQISQSVKRGYEDGS